MVIDYIPDVRVPTIQTRNTDKMEMNDTSTMASSTSSDQQAPTDMLHALHHDEKELRILAVVLSLTGGLVLSFFLGVGIFVYWHWRAWRARRRKKYLKSKKLQSSTKATAVEPVAASMPAPIPSPSSSTSSLSTLSSLSIVAIDDSRVSTRHGENTSVCSPHLPTSPPNPIASSSISSISTTTMQRTSSSPTVALSSLVSASPSIHSPPMPSNISTHSGSNYVDSSHILSSGSDMTKCDIVNGSAIYCPFSVITNPRDGGCSVSSTSSTSNNHHSAHVIPPLLLGPSASTTPIPTAPSAKECLGSPSPSSSNPLSPHDMSTGPSFDPPDIPPPAYSPN